MFGKELFIWLTVCVLRGCWLKFFVCSSFPFGIEGWMWDVIVLIPDHCLSIYLLIMHRRQKFGGLVYTLCWFMLLILYPTGNTEVAPFSRL